MLIYFSRSFFIGGETIKNNIKEENKGQFISDAFLLTASALTVKILGVIYKIPLSYALTDEGMGYFNTAYTIFSCFYIICSAGVPKAVSILSSKYRAAGETENALRVFKMARSAFTFIGLICTFLLIILRNPISRLLANNKAAPSLLSIAFSLVFISVSGVYKGYLNGLGKHIPIALAEVTEAIFKLVFGLFFAYISMRGGLSYEYVSAYTICGISVGAVASSFILCLGVKISKSKDKTEQNSRLCHGKQKILKKIFKISIPIALTSLILGAVNLIDLSLIMRRLCYAGYSSYEANNLYGNYTTLATPFLNFTVAIVSPISAAALPRLCKAHTTGKGDKLLKETENMISFSLFLSVPLSIGFIFFSKEILSFIFTEKAALIAAPHLTLLAPAFTVSALLICVNTVLESTGHTFAPLICMSAASVFKIISTYYLVGNRTFGISGASIGTVIFYSAALVFSASYLRKSEAQNIGIAKPFMKYCAPSIVSAYTAKAMISYFDKIGIHELLSTVISALIYAIIYLLLVKTTTWFGILKTKNVKYAQKNEKVLSKEPIVDTKY